MIALHTAVITHDVLGRFHSAEDLLREGAGAWVRTCADSGAESVLLDREIPSGLWGMIEASLRPPSGAFSVLAMYPPAFSFPGGPAIPVEEAPALADPDRQRRESALKAHLRLLPLADRLDCRLWLVRLGRAVMEPVMEELHGLWERDRLPGEGDGIERAREIMEERRRKVSGLVDPARSSLERLARAAEGFGVTLCIENRRDVRCFPNYSETEALLEDLAGAPLGYWHNAGHASVHEQLGLMDAKVVLHRLGPWLRGGTLHDALGARGHLPPGEGRLDFAALRRAVPGGLPWAVDVRRRRKGVSPAGEAAEEAVWEKRRVMRGRGGLGHVVEEKTEFISVEPGSIAEWGQTFGEMGF